MSEKVVILGGGFLGVNAALDLAPEKEVVLIDKDLNHSYIPGTIDLIRGRLEKEDIQVELEEFLPDGIELMEAEVKDVRTEEKTVETKHGLVGYDKLVVGLGGQPADFGKDISAAEHVWGVKPAQQLMHKSEEAESALVIGGGYVGIEVAGELAEKGLETTIVDMATRPLTYLQESSSEKMLKHLQKKDIKFKGGKAVEKILEPGVETEEGEKLEADLIVWAGGVQASQTVQEAFSTEPGGLEVNKGLSAVNIENVFAGGDTADIDGQKTAHKAMNQGEVIAENILSNPEPLEEAEAEQSFLIASLGDEAALIYRDRLLFTAEFLRTCKDLVRTYYFARLKLKKKFPSVDFLP